MENVYYHTDRNVDIKTLSKWILGGLYHHNEFFIKTPYYPEMLRITKAAIIVRGFFRESENRNLSFVPSIEFSSNENGNKTHSIMRFVLEEKK